MTSKPILYYNWRSSCAARVRIALNLKKIDYDLKTVTGDELQSTAYLNINPARKIPTLVVDGQTLTESLAIIEYLEETYTDGVRLLPNDPIKRAQARAIALHIASGIHPLQTLRVVKYVESKTPGEGIKWAAHWVKDGLRDLERLLAKTAGKYAVGDEVSIADLGIPSILYNARRFNVDTAEFPIACHISTTLSTMDEFRTAAAENQPDAAANSNTLTNIPGY